MESQDQPLPTERNETPEWEEEIVAENKDTARVDIDSGTGGKGEAGEQEEERAELAKEGEKTKAKKPKGVASQAREAQGIPGSNEYILDGFDFSTGTIQYTILYVHAELCLEEVQTDHVLAQKCCVITFYPHMLYIVKL